MGRRKEFEERRIVTAVRLPRELHEQLQRVAHERDTSINHLIAKAAESYLSRLPPLELPEDSRAV